jgi:hypothetical protein
VWGYDISLSYLDDALKKKRLPTSLFYPPSLISQR